MTPVQMVGEAEVFPHNQGELVLASSTITGPTHPHAHEFAELIYVREGSGLQLTESGVTNLQEGTLIVLGAGAWHSLQPDEELSLESIYVSSRLIDGALSWVGELEQIGPALCGMSGSEDAMAAFSLSETVASQLRSVFDTWGHDTDRNLLFRLARFFDVLSVLAAIDDSGGNVAFCPRAHACATGACCSLLSARYRTPVAQAVALLRERIDEAWTVELLAREVALSVSHLTRLFRADVDTTPMAYLQKTRAERFAVLLRTTTMTVSQAGQAVGWNDPNYASRRFRGHWKMTPTEYRRSYGTGTLSRTR